MTYAYVDEVLGRAPAYAGVLYAVQGAGSVAVGLLAGPLLRRLPERVFAAGGMALLGLAVGARAVPEDSVALAAGAGLVAVVDARVIAAGAGAVGVVAAAVLARGAFVRRRAPG